MARKFWERVGGNQIRFYDEPLQVLKDETLARIAELQEILAAPDHIKAFIAQGNPAINTEEEFEEIFTDELEELAERLDYWDMDTIVESIDVADSGWFNLSDGQLGPGTVVAVCGEEIGNEAPLAIDGQGGTNWQHDHDHTGEEDEFHELIVDLGYKARIDGIRFNLGATPGNALRLSVVNIYVASSESGVFNNPNAHVGVDLEATAPNNGNFAELDLTIRTGRFVRITVGSTGHNLNHITLKDFEIRKRPRTQGL